MTDQRAATRDAAEERRRVESWEVLRNAIDRVGVKAVAARLRISAALVYKWCQEPDRTDGEGASGARNPLDRVLLVYRMTTDPTVINWLCHKSGGFFVPNPAPAAGLVEEELLGATQRVVRDFSDLLADISRSVANDGQITLEEAEAIRATWERLKFQAEAFVLACERGDYADKKHP